MCSSIAPRRQSEGSPRQCRDSKHINNNHLGGRLSLPPRASSGRPHIMLDIENLGLVYPARSKKQAETVALQDVNLNIRQGEFVALLGSSGCGKSTLLNILAGLLKPQQGQVLVSGKPLTDIHVGVGYVPQGDVLFPWRRVQSNIEIGLELKGVGRQERKAAVSDIIKVVGLAGFERAYPAELSGGMKKRVGLARCFVMNPKIVLMDEPFSALDAQLRIDMQAELLEIWREHNSTVVFVTHDLEEAVSLSDRVVVFSPRPGRIVGQISIEFERPRDVVELRYTREFIHVCNDVRNLLKATNRGL